MAEKAPPFEHMQSDCNYNIQSILSDVNQKSKPTRRDEQKLMKIIKMLYPNVAERNLKTATCNL